ncbi:MAG: phosphate ABC transporter permease PstA [Anaerolineales bacterium]|nr:phosphate ABC transporter permease PstA [Anaerolineales bacterium]
MKNFTPKIEEGFYKVLMVASTAFVLSILALILATVVWRGLPALNLAMLTQIPKGGYYLGKEGGILNAIVGSLCLAGGATVLALVLSLPIAIYLQLYASRTRQAELARLALDVLWGVPSIVYGAFGFIILLWLGMRASLLGGIIALALLELPIMVRGMDEAIAMVPPALKETSYALGATRYETAIKVMVRQTAPGLLTAVLLAFGRGIGDSASVLFTAGYTDRLPNSLFRPAASLPLAVFFQLNTPYLAVQERAYASALVLTFIILTLSLIARRLTGRLTANIIR